MGKCIPCTTVTQDERDIIRYYKKLHEIGITYYVYRTESKGAIKFVKKEDFNLVFEREIKPNFPNGAEYFSIIEFTA